MTRHQLGLNCLGFYEEAVGTLHGIDVDHGLLIARISKVILALPVELEAKLAPLMGTRIGILRTDILGKEYLVRRIPEKKAQALDEIKMNDLTAPKAQREMGIA
jgi:hypothetical protein